MNALSLLKQDHDDVEALFLRFEALDDDAAPTEKRDIVEQIITLLSVHAEIEEQIFYPALRAKLDDDSDVLEGLEEHHSAKFLLSELDKLPASHERFDAKVTVLIEHIRHHVGEEEGDDGLFAEARTAFKPKELEEMGKRMEDLKKVAPTRPHPLSPDVPPLNTLIGLPVAVADRVYTTGKQIVTKVLRGAA
jgi:hemerythrin-like domain-containing protein